ncbi:carboxypeptidase regulatory-like domain-containing protein [Spirosoma aureum]|uniref:Carboxypeptidase regulatory-like domain-containing protein n=1 Tax=Spirosoma aureum TaxID=2692134 RepID=A0A6G9AP06_9BACT|nr:carboxypeptidase-like regulatory domain-containing protein [Spirosoma aureum]QIP14128.1 carboxypeptidase regulatory-like domain-containing protein [Spirosoma aureum]
MKFKFLLVSIFFVAFGCKESVSTDAGQSEQWGQQPELPVVNGEARFTLEAQDNFVNVMGNTLPRMPIFPTLQPKAGRVRGYVADLSGKPLRGATIGVRSTATGGYYSGVSAQTDAKGYYELTVPWGAADFYAAGYTIDYGQGRVTMSLYSIDGKLESFPSKDGLVKNFVLLSYGVLNKDMAGQKPNDPTNYAGGSFYITYNVADPSSVYNPSTYIPDNAEIQVTLVPDGVGLYREKKTFVITKKASQLNYNFLVMNVPVGSYTLKANLKNGPQLRLEAVGRYASVSPYFGLKPSSAVGSAQLFFTPDSQLSNSLTLPNRGNWGSLQIKVELP